VKVNPAGIDAYRQIGRTDPGGDTAGDRAIKKTPSGIKTEKISLPGTPNGSTPAVRVANGPSLLAGILSPDEKSALVKNFARFGDTPGSAAVYGTRANTQQPTLVGQKVDLKG
jgi:hypothetical protein